MKKISRVFLRKPNADNQVSNHSNQRLVLYLLRGTKLIKCGDEQLNSKKPKKTSLISRISSFMLRKHSKSDAPGRE